MRKLAFTLAVFFGFATLTGCMLLSRHSKAPKDDRPDGIVRLHDYPSGRFFCSGVVISDTQILSAKHCMDDRDPAMPMIIVCDSTETVCTFAQTAYYRGDSRRDLGMLGGDFSMFKPYRVAADSIEVIITLKSQYSRLEACGYPGGAELVCSPFEVIGSHDFWVAGTSYIYPGMSGGPVIDRRTNTVIGSISAVASNLSLFNPLIGWGRGQTH